MAPAITGASLAAPPHAALPPPGFSSALAAAMGGAADPLGLADSASGAPEQRAPAPLSTVPATPVQAATAGQDVPRQIAVQIAQAAEGGTGGARGTVELSLSPEELGRVRLRLHPSEAGLSVTITADRAETLELMRRNIDVLAREFLDIGYQDTQFDFTRGGQDTDDDNAAASAASAPALTAASPDTEQPAPAASLVMSDRLDIRL
ncbi:MAG: flagellar hook-length control protein FliK [Roseovarius sp.]|nr:flagellar hook-length control protein FliK [Roseovarius sp.]